MGILTVTYFYLINRRYKKEQTGTSKFVKTLRKQILSVLRLTWLFELNFSIVNKELNLCFSLNRRGG